MRLLKNYFLVSKFQRSGLLNLTTPEIISIPLYSKYSPLLIPNYVNSLTLKISKEWKLQSQPNQCLSNKKDKVFWVSEIPHRVQSPNSSTFVVLVGKCQAYKIRGCEFSERVNNGKV